MTNEANRYADAFSPRLLEVVQHPPSPLPRTITLTLILLLALVSVWLFVGQLDIVARAQGKLVPKTRVKVVQPFEGGRVSKILVKEGQLVEAGETLLLMDGELSIADFEKVRSELAAATLQVRRIEAELAGSEFARLDDDDATLFEQVLSQYNAHRGAYLHALGQQKALLRQAEQERAAAQEVLKKLAETLPLHKASEKAFKELGKQGYADRLAVMDRERERIEVERDLSSQRFTLRALESKIREAQEKEKAIQASYRRQLLDEQVDLNNRAAQLEQDIAKQQYRSELLALKAPQKGFIKDLATTTEGTVLPAGSVVLNIVPLNDPLQAEIYVEQQDIGFVAEQQEARIKLASYEFQKYGVVDGAVAQVSADSASPDANAEPSATTAMRTGYRALVDLGKQYIERGGKQFRLRPGMQVTAEIKIGSRSVIDYLLSPIERALDEAGTER